MWFAAEAPTTTVGNVVTNPAPTRPIRAAGTTPSAALERLAAYATTTAPIAMPPPIAMPVLAPARHERMFGAPMPVSQATYLEEKDALRRMLTDKSVDVMVLAGAPPLPLLAAMTPEAVHSIKMLELDRDEPQSRRALQPTCRLLLRRRLRAKRCRPWL